MYSLSVALIHLLFFFNDTATTEIYTLSLHDALPISSETSARDARPSPQKAFELSPDRACPRSEEHTSELQSRFDLVCRLLLEKKNNTPCHRLSGTHNSYAMSLPPYDLYSL